MNREGEPKPVTAEAANSGTPVACEGPDSSASSHSVRTERSLLDPAILPSDTSVRFAVLIAMVFASTTTIYMSLSLSARPGVEEALPGCLSGLSLIVPSIMGTRDVKQAQSLLQVTVGCVKADAPVTAIWALIGLALVGLSAWITYRAMPQWRIRRQRLVVLDRIGFAELVAHLDALVERVGLARAPTFLIAPYQYTPSGLAFGFRRRWFVQLNAGLVQRFGVDRPAFTAIVLHELAHFRNRDIWRTYFTIAVWRSFLFLAFIPYVGLLICPRLFSDPLHWRLADVRPWVPNIHISGAVLALTVLLYLSRSAVLRVRETHADATAALFEHDGALARILATVPPTHRSAWWRLLRMHPSARQRRTVLENPTALFSSGFMAMVGAGIAIALVSANLNLLVTVIGIAMAPTIHVLTLVILLVFFSTGAIATVLIAGLASVTMWRARLRVCVAAVRVPVVRLAVALALGMLLGEPLSIVDADAGLWGVVYGVGWQRVIDAVVATLLLVMVIVLVFRWMSEAAAVWLPVTRGSLRRACLWTAVVGTVALFPVFTLWFMFHAQPGIATVRLWTPDLAHAQFRQYYDGPGTSWVQIQYAPDSASELPGLARVSWIS